MTTEAYKAWLNAMPIDDVNCAIKRLDAELADSLVLVRLYALRRLAAAAVPLQPTGQGFSSEPRLAEVPPELISAGSPATADDEVPPESAEEESPPGSPA